MIVTHAVGLKAADKNGLSDPLVRLNTGAFEIRSKVCADTLDPTWNEQFTFSGTFDELCLQPLKLTVLDHDGKFSKASSLGDVTLPLADSPLWAGDWLEYNWALNDGQPKPGVVWTKLRWESDEKTRAAGERVGVLQLHLSHATNLCAADKSGTSDPYFKLIAGGCDATLRSKVGLGRALARTRADRLP